jgi:hypothetical protein
MLGVERLTPGDDSQALGYHDEFCPTAGNGDTPPCNNCSLEHFVLGVSEGRHEDIVKLGSTD